MLDRTPTESHLQRSLAQVFVTDFARAPAFYSDTLDSTSFHLWRATV
jgi:hypothetical protein